MVLLSLYLSQSIVIKDFYRLPVRVRGGSSIGRLNKIHPEFSVIVTLSYGNLRRLAICSPCLSVVKLQPRSRLGHFVQAIITNLMYIDSESHDNLFRVTRYYWLYEFFFTIPTYH
jgi:hypothetical protein